MILTIICIQSATGEIIYLTNSKYPKYFFKRTESLRLRQTGYMTSDDHTLLKIYIKYIF